jgi:hypothetical protein
MEEFEQLPTVHLIRTPYAVAFESLTPIWWAKGGMTPGITNAERQ